MKFSILNLLLVLTAVAALVGLYSSRQAIFEVTRRYEVQVSELNAKQEDLQEQNRALRQELGSLTITDPKKIHAIKLRTTAPKTWSYRVYLPDGANYYFACQINSLPLVAVPPTVTNPPGPSTIGSITNNSSGVGRPPGEYVVTLSVQQADDEWRYQLNVREAGNAGDGNTGGSIIDNAEDKWPNVADFVSVGGVSNQVELSVDRSPLLLLDFRAMSGNVTSSDKSDQGAMLWVGVTR